MESDTEWLNANHAAAVDAAVDAAAAAQTFALLAASNTSQPEKKESNKLLRKCTAQKLKVTRLQLQNGTR